MFVEHTIWTQQNMNLISDPKILYHDQRLHERTSNPAHLRFHIQRVIKRNLLQCLSTPTEPVF